MAKKEALLIIDMQYDFIPPSGSLAVTGIKCVLFTCVYRKAFHG